MNVSKAKGGFFMRSKKVDPRVLLPEQPILLVKTTNALGNQRERAREHCFCWDGSTTRHSGVSVLSK